jgi:hypothetical protein
MTIGWGTAFAESAGILGGVTVLLVFGPSLFRSRKKKQEPREPVSLITPATSPDGLRIYRVRGCDKTFLSVGSAHQYLGEGIHDR